MLLGNATVRFSLERLAEAGSTDQIQKVAKGLMTIMKGNEEFDNTLISTIIRDSDNLGSFTFDNRGQQYIDLNTATGIGDRGSSNIDPPFTEKTLLHEIVHAAPARCSRRGRSTAARPVPRRPGLPCALRPCGGSSRSESLAGRHQWS